MSSQKITIINSTKRNTSPKRVDRDTVRHLFFVEKLTKTEIAKRLHVTVSTIDYHINRLLFPEHVVETIQVKPANYEFKLFGISFKLDQRPSFIEKNGDIISIE